MCISKVSCFNEPYGMTSEHYAILLRRIDITDSYHFSVEMWKISSSNITLSEKMKWSNKID